MALFIDFDLPPVLCLLLEKTQPAEEMVDGGYDLSEVDLIVQYLFQVLLLKSILNPSFWKLPSSRHEVYCLGGRSSSNKNPITIPG